MEYAEGGWIVKWCEEVNIKSDPYDSGQYDYQDKQAVFKESEIKQAGAKLKEISEKPIEVRPS